MITLTHQNIHELGTNGAGFNSAQLTVLGCEGSERGWLRRLIGKQISEDDWKLLMELKGASKEKQKRLVPERKPFFVQAKARSQIIPQCRHQFRMLLLCLKAGEKLSAQDHARKIMELCC